MDVLTDIVESVRLSNSLHGRWELSAPWGLQIGGWRAHACFYVVTRGMALVEVEGQEKPLHVAGGDYFMVARGQRHAIRDSADTEVRPIAEVMESCPKRRECQPGGVFEHGGGGAHTTLVSGCFAFADEDNHLLAALPPVIHVRGDQGPPRQWLEASLQFLAAEMASGQVGAQTVVSRLADILLVQAIRAHLAQGGEASRGWLRALLDQQISQALGLIHERPADAWTVDALASRVAMSRSAFAARFSTLVGEPPLTYLTRWRMHRAGRLLASGDTRIGDIARQVGYETESAFHKAFKRWTGMAPRDYRRARTNGGAAEAPADAAAAAAETKEAGAAR